MRLKKGDYLLYENPDEGDWILEYIGKDNEKEYIKAKCVYESIKDGDKNRIDTWRSPENVTNTKVRKITEDELFAWLI